MDKKATFISSCIVLLSMVFAGCGEAGGKYAELDKDSAETDAQEAGEENEESGEEAAPALPMKRRRTGILILKS